MCGDSVLALLLVYPEIPPTCRGWRSHTRKQRVFSATQWESHQYYPEETMVRVWFSGPHSDLSLCGVWPWVQILGQWRVSSSALPRASESALAGCPGLANRFKWQRENPKASLFTTFKYDSKICKTPQMQHNADPKEHQTRHERKIWSCKDPGLDGWAK